MKYEIKGNDLPVVICYLENGETMITERGSMSWMSPNMKMETTSNGGIGKALGRMFAGENRAGQRSDRSEIRLSRSGGERGIVCFLPEKAGSRFIRRRGIYHAETLRSGNGIPRI